MMRVSLRRVTAFVGIAMLGMQSASCYRLAERTPHDVIRPDRATGLRWSVQGATMQDQHWFDLQNDSVWVTRDTLYAKSRTGASRRFPVDSINSLTVNELDGKRTAWLTVGVGVAALALLVYIGVRDVLSCYMCGANFSGITNRAPATSVRTQR